MSGDFAAARLGEVADLNPALCGPPTDDELVSFLPMSAVEAECVDAVDTEVCRFEEVSKGYTPFLPDDVLVAKITPCFENGKIAQAKPTMRFGFGSTEFHVLRPHPGKLDPRFLVHFLRQKWVRLEGERKMTGSAGQRRVPEHFLATLAIPVPPLPEQRRIAEILDKADALRAKRRAALAQLDALTQSIFLDMFGDPATNPKGWPRAALRDLGRVTTGGTPPSAKDGMFGGSILFITPGDLESHEPIKRSVTEAGAKEARTVQAGATLVCCIGATIGKIGKATERSAFNQQINAVEWGNTVDPEYGYAVLRFFKPTIIAWGSSTTLPILKKSAFERIEVPVPSLEQQRKFAERISHVDGLRVLNRTALMQNDDLVVSLQCHAFQGDLWLGVDKVLELMTSLSQAGAGS